MIREHVVELVDCNCAILVGLTYLHGSWHVSTATHCTLAHPLLSRAFAAQRTHSLDFNDCKPAQCAAKLHQDCLYPAEIRFVCGYSTSKLLDKEVFLHRVISSPHAVMLGPSPYPDSLKHLLWTPY